jgi:hypothetical protein
MLLRVVGQLLRREVRAIQREIALYPDGDSLWKELPGVPNTGGTLALHAAGNIQHFVGAVVGGTGYVRQREREFTLRGVAPDEVVAELERAVAAVEHAVAETPEERLSEAYPLPVGERRVATADFLVHLATHLAYHLGQIDYHRRMVTGVSSGVDAVSVKEFAAGVALPD